MRKLLRSLQVTFERVEKNPSQGKHIIIIRPKHTVHASTAMLRTSPGVRTNLGYFPGCRMRFYPRVGASLERSWPGHRPNPCCHLRGPTPCQSRGWGASVSGQGKPQCGTHAESPVAVCSLPSPTTYDLRYPPAPVFVAFHIPYMQTEI